MDQARLPEIEKTWVLMTGTYFSYGLFAAFSIGYLIGGWTWLLPAIFILILVPTLDAIAGGDLSQRTMLPAKSLGQLLLRFAPYGFVVGYTFCIVLVAGDLEHLTFLEAAFATFSVGMIGSIATTASLELVHKSARRAKAFGRLGLAGVCYLHFEIAHIRGHHVQVGTPLDESTAWKGESLYSYLGRTLPRCLALAWKLERRRLDKETLAARFFRDLMLWFFVIQTAYFVGLYLLGGWPAIVFFIIQAGIAVLMLETVSYIEHYGLVREKLAHGRYGNMTPAHSWDSYHRFSNYLEFHLQRHADHHATLRSYTRSCSRFRQRRPGCRPDTR